MKVLKNYIYNASYQLLVMIVPLITTPYVNRILGPKGIGINTYTNTIIQYFILFGGFGIALYGNREIAYVRDSPRKLQETFCEIQIVHTIGILISSIIFFIYLITFSHYKLYMLLQFINLLAAAFDISWFFQGIENFKITVLRNTVIKLSCIMLIFILIHNRHQIGIYILIYAISTFLGNMTLWPSIRNYFQFKIKLLHLHPWRHFIPAVGLFIPEVAVQIYQTLNKTILGLIVSVSAAGFYFDSDTLIKMLLALITSLSTVMLPHVSNQFINGKIKEIKKVTYSSFNIVTCISIAFMFGIASISLKFSILFFGKSFSAVGPAMMLESPVIYFASVSTILGGQYLIPTHQVKAYSTSLVLGAITSIISNFAFIPTFHLYGAVISTVLSEIVVLLYQLYLVKTTKQLEIRKLFDGTIKYLFSGVIMFVVVFSIDRCTGCNFIFILLEVSLGVMVYVVLMLLLHTNIIEIIKVIKKY